MNTLLLILAVSAGILGALGALLADVRVVGLAIVLLAVVVIVKLT